MIFLKEDLRLSTSIRGRRRGRGKGEQLEIKFNRILNGFACLTPLPISCQKAGTVAFCISQKHVKHRYSTSIY